MCTGFGMIVTKDLKGYFCKPGGNGNVSHSTILDRLEMKENKDKFVRQFVRIECPEWTIDSFRFDEDDTLPGWAENSKDEIIGLVDKVLSRAYPAWAKYEKVRATAQAEYRKARATAQAEYEKVRATAWAEYRKARATAQAEYEKARATAQDEYEKVRDTAWDEYEKARATAQDEYEKVRDTAWAEYEKARATAWAEFVGKLSKLPGYVGE